MPRASECNLFKVLIFAVLFSTPAYGEKSEETAIFMPGAADDRARFRTSEFFGSWGLDWHGFDAAYAQGATGQGVILGQLDSPLWVDHPEFAGISFGPLGLFPPAVRPIVDWSGQLQNHGQHVAGIMIGRKDGAVMHGGAFGVTRFLAGYYNDDGAANWNARLTGTTLSQSILETKVDFVNHSYGYDFDEYAFPVPQDNGSIGYRGPNIHDLARYATDTHVIETSIHGVVNITAAGNDRFYSMDSFNRYGVRPRLFRGISVGEGNSLAPFLDSGNEGMGDDVWRRLEKGTVAVVNINQTGEIDYTSNICGISKYYCLSAAGTEVLSTVPVSIAPEGAPAEEIVSPFNLRPDYQTMTGTSMAAPLVTAGHAIVKSRFPYLENWQVRDILLTTARDKGAPGIDRVYGWGDMDIEAAMDGPRMIFGLRRDYFEKLEEFEADAAVRYDLIVARADVFAGAAHHLLAEYIENEQRARAAEQAGYPEVAADLRALNSVLMPQAEEAARRAFEIELTRDQPNDPRDTPAAAFERTDYVVNIPGRITETCPSERCVADVWQNDINGPSTFVKTGGGLLAFAGTNTYEGGTRIEEGVMQLGIGGETGSITGDIRNDAILSYARSSEWAYDGVISGSGVLDVHMGIMRLTGRSTYSGDSTIYGGEFAVDGSIVSRAVVLPGSVLSGMGSVGGIVARPAGIVAPAGAAIGSLTVTAADGGLGSVELEPGSILAIGIEGDISDRLEVQKTASIGDSFLMLSKLGAQMELRTPLTVKDLRALKGNRYTVLTAGEGVFGRFDERGLPSLIFLGAAVDYSPTTATVSVDQTKHFADVGASANQKAAAGAIEALGEGDPLYETVLVSQNPETARWSFNATSGEVHASVKGSLVTDAVAVQRVTANRIRAAFANVGAASMSVMAYGPDGTLPAPGDTLRPAVWSQAYGAWGSREGDGNAAGVSRTTGGILMGADALAGDWRIGLAGGYSRSKTEIDARSSSAEVDAYTVAVYGGRQIGPLGLRFGAAHAWHAIDTSRSIVFADIHETAKASYDARTMQVFGEMGYAVGFGAARFEPFVNLAHVKLSVDGYREKAQSAGLTGAASRDGVTFTSLGLRADTDLPLGERTMRVYGTLGWRHAFGEVTPTATHAFGGGQPFTVSGAPLARDAALVEAGLDFSLARNASFAVSYQGQIASSTREHGFAAKLNLAF
ncbi:autotransporter domain-containing protein [Phyllobacterium salinisoli]|nr:autotransporter serine protease [Phyllobacterium salinisoli]